MLEIWQCPKCGPGGNGRERIIIEAGKLQMLTIDEGGHILDVQVGSPEAYRCFDCDHEGEAADFRLP